MAPDVHPNCVWLEFLQTWTEDARAKGLKAASAYQRAHRSLAAVTEPFVHPRETVRLPGIGDSIAKRLEKEYAQWCTANGQPIPERRMCPLSRSIVVAAKPDYFANPSCGTYDTAAAAAQRICP